MFTTMTRHARARLVKAFDALDRSNDELRRELVRHKQATGKAVEKMLARAATRDAIRTEAMPEIRAELTGALDRFEEARHEARLAVFAYLGQLPDVTASDIGKALGISRQLASRLANEAG
jgi:hypothetical protein